MFSNHHKHCTEELDGAERCPNITIERTPSVVLSKRTPLKNPYA